MPYELMLYYLVNGACIIAGILGILLVIVMLAEIFPDELHRLRAWTRLKRTKFSAYAASVHARIVELRRVRVSKSPILG